VTNFKY